MSCEFNKKWFHFNVNDIVYSECNFYDNLTFSKNYNNESNKINMICIKKVIFICLR